MNLLKYSFALLLGAILLPTAAHSHSEACCPEDAVRCLALPGVSVTLLPGADSKAVEEKLLPPGGEKYRVSSRLWTRTAMTPEVHPRQPFILTYSFVPDGTPIEPVFPGESSDPSNLYQRMNQIFPGGEEQWKSIIREALTSWSRHAPITFIEAPDDGAPLPASPGVPGVRGDIRIAMHRINEPGSIDYLSYAYYPNDGEIVLDYITAPELYTPEDGFMLMTELFVHEQGHGLGLNHVDPLNGTKIMEAFIGIGRYFPQEDDIRGVKFAYGDRYRPNQTPQDAAPIGPVPLLGPTGTDTPRTIPSAAIFQPGEDDWYEFHLPEPGLLDLRVVPIGTTYPEGAEFGEVSNLDARSVHNLGFELTGPPPGNLSVTVQEAPAGQPDALEGLELEAGGPYRVRVFTTTGTNATQRYELEIGYRQTAARPAMWLFY